MTVVTTVVYSESTCNRCGKVEREANQTRGEIPITWACMVTHQKGVMSIFSDLCPACLPEFTAFMEEEGLKTGE